MKAGVNSFLLLCKMKMLIVVAVLLVKTDCTKRGEAEGTLREFLI